MALVRTTLSAAITNTSTSVLVASATGISAGYIGVVDDEVVQVVQTYVAGSTTVGIRRGLNGTAAVAHPVTAGIVFGAASDFPQPGSSNAVNYPLAGRTRTLVSYSAAGAIALPAAGTDVVAVLNGTDVLAMTLADPTKDMDGCILTIAANGAAAHTVTYTTGFGGAGGSYDVLTANGTGTCCVQVIAVNSKWLLVGPPTGTLTNAAWALA